jgi:hypothetical protein
METKKSGEGPPWGNSSGIRHAGVHGKGEAERVAKNGGKEGKQRRGG